MVWETQFDYPLVVQNLVFFLPVPTATGVVVLGVTFSVSPWDAWLLLSQSGKAGHYNPLMRTLSENVSTSG